MCILAFALQLIDRSAGGLVLSFTVNTQLNHHKSAVRSSVCSNAPDVELFLPEVVNITPSYVQPEKPPYSRQLPSRYCADTNDLPAAPASKFEP